MPETSNTGAREKFPEQGISNSSAINHSPKPKNTPERVAIADPALNEKCIKNSGRSAHPVVNERERLFYFISVRAGDAVLPSQSPVRVFRLCSPTLDYCKEPAEGEVSLTYNPDAEDYSTFS